MPVTFEEIYDFVQDIRVERERNIPKIGKADISLGFHMLCRLASRCDNQSVIDIGSDEAMSPHICIATCVHAYY